MSLSSALLTVAGNGIGDVAKPQPPVAPGSSTMAVRWTRAGKLTRMQGGTDPAAWSFAAVIKVPRPYRATPAGWPPLVACRCKQGEVEGKEFPDLAEEGLTGVDS